MSILAGLSDSIFRITLDRPEKLNAFSGTMREDLLAALQTAEADPEARCVVITGAGRAFCSGGDVEFMASLQHEGDEARFRGLLEAGRNIVLAIATMTKPVVASVNGVAAGAGCNLALACDIRIASEHARFSESFVRIGLHPDWGGTFTLPRVVGRSRAFELMATGRMVDAAEALQIGLVDRVVPASELAAETDVLAAALAAAPPVAIAGLKRALAASDANGLDAQIALETEQQLRCFRSKDAAEGMAAFFEKRKPAFRGE